MAFLTEKRVKLLCFVMAVLFMVIHVGMFLLFSKYRVTFSRSVESDGE